MSSLRKNFKDDEGNDSVLEVSSNDGYTVNLNKNYTIANRAHSNESALAKKFKGSMLGADIGVKSKGFSTVAVLAIVIALAGAITLYLLWRF